MSDVVPIDYPSRATMARRLDCSESSIDELVKRGTIPPPITFLPGIVRWDWSEVQAFMNGLKAGPFATMTEGRSVYVIKSEAGAIKIGIAINPRARLSSLQTASAVPLSLAYVGGCSGGSAADEVGRKLTKFCVIAANVASGFRRPWRKPSAQ
jgi:predicted DNA-binding transcriptional regulator AlpA